MTSNMLVYGNLKEYKDGYKLIKCFRITFFFCRQKEINKVSIRNGRMSRPLSIKMSYYHIQALDAIKLQMYHEK